MEFDDSQTAGWAEARYDAMRMWVETQLARAGLDADPNLVIIAAAAVLLAFLALTLRLTLFRRGAAPQTKARPGAVAMVPAPGSAAERAAGGEAPFVFVIAKLAGDREGAAAQIAASAAAAFPDAKIERIGRVISGAPAETDPRALRELTRRRGVALLHGRCLDGALSLRFATAAQDGDEPAAKAAAETIVLPWTGEAVDDACVIAALAAAGRPPEPARDRYVETILAPALERLKTLTDPLPSQRSGLDRARIWQALGLAAMRAYEDSAEADDLDDALRAAEAAVCDGRRPSAPAEWSAAEVLRGRAITARGERDGDAAAMGDAARAFRGALSVEDVERAPLARARLQLTLAETLLRAAAADPGVEGLEEATVALSAAVATFQDNGEVRSEARARVARARALSLAGRRSAGVTRLEEAAQAYRFALEERRDAAALGPHFDWAALQHEYADVLIALGERERGVKRLGEAVAAYRLALEARSRADAPRAWAESQRGLGAALGVMGEREKGAESLSEAVVALRAALTVYEDMRAANAAAKVRRDLARAERVLAERRAANGGP